MASIDELLESANQAGCDDELSFIIDEHLRIITVPERGVVLGVEGDKDVNRVRFRMNRFYHGSDLSEFCIRINYQNADGDINYFTVTEKTVETDSFCFIWTVAADATMVKGTVLFVVNCFMTDVDGVVQKAYHTTLGSGTVLEGLEPYEGGDIPEIVDYLTHLKNDLMIYSGTLVTGAEEAAAAASRSATEAAKAVDITVPTKTSQLTNDSSWQTSAQVASAIQTAIAKTGHASFQKVDTVPGVDSATENVMYLVLNPKTKHYDIYAKIKGANGSYTMEQLDDTTVDLSGYMQKENGKRLMTDAEGTKLAGIAEGANKYTHPTYTARSSGLYKVTVDASGHVTEVAPVTKADITGLGIPGTNTTYSPMSGATSSAAGTNGLVPAPPAGAQGKFLRGDGTWQPLVSYGEATATNAGLMSAADKTKLDGLVLATSAEVKAMLDEVFAEA